MNLPGKKKRFASLEPVFILSLFWPRPLTLRSNPRIFFYYHIKSERITKRSGKKRYKQKEKAIKKATKFLIAQRFIIITYLKFFIYNRYLKLFIIFCSFLLYGYNWFKISSSSRSSMTTLALNSAV